MDFEGGAAMRVTTHDQLLELLDGLYADRTSRDAAGFWDALLLQEDHPLHSDLPDAALVTWKADGLLGDRPGRTALDVGCGLGRNSRWLADSGFRGDRRRHRATAH
jgi:2-polyprenyl-3-methyl-5-hydroxy-6-metoxy-1,4-benzoquinol methylase